MNCLDEWEHVELTMREVCTIALTTLELYTHIETNTHTRTHTHTHPHPHTHARARDIDTLY